MNNLEISRPVLQKWKLRVGGFAFQSDHAYLLLEVIGRAIEFHNDIRMSEPPFTYEVLWTVFKNVVD
jgi:hypothetical protein